MGFYGKVLIVEDKRWRSKKEIEKALEGYKEIRLFWTDKEHAMAVLSKISDIAICILDACTGKNKMQSTVALAEKILKVFHGKIKIIVMSCTAPTRVPLMVAGCHYECSKGNLAQTLIEVLELDQPVIGWQMKY